MIDLTKAVSIANTSLHNMSSSAKLEIVLLENETIEKECYWIFFYNSKEYIETGNFSYCLAGNSPLIIDKFFGGVHQTGTAYPLEVYTSKFEETVLPGIISRQ